MVAPVLRYHEDPVENGTRNHSGAPAPLPISNPPVRYEPLIATLFGVVQLLFRFGTHRANNSCNVFTVTCVVEGAPCTQTLEPIVMRMGKTMGK